jgi:hypothetical protein
MPQKAVKKIHSASEESAAVAIQNHNFQRRSSWTSGIHTAAHRLSVRVEQPAGDGRGGVVLRLRW